MRAFPQPTKSHTHSAMFAAPKSIQAMVTILENLHVIIEKTPLDETRSDVFPMLFNAFDSVTIQIQSAALVAVVMVAECLDDTSVRRILIPKIKMVFDKNPTDIKIVLLILQCIERILDKMEKSQVTSNTPKSQPRPPPPLFRFSG